MVPPPPKPATVEKDPKAEPDMALEQPPTAEADIYIGRAKGRKIHTIMTTRKGGIKNQALVRYTPMRVPAREMPGYSDLIQLFASQGRQLPSEIVRIDQETETLVDNLGEPLRSISSSHLYLNPINATVIAYDVVNTTGGQAQRFLGHLTRTGITVEVFRGGEYADRHELPFQNRDTFIPIEMEFIHAWYENNPEAARKREIAKFSLFIPEVMGFVKLEAKPLDHQVIPIKDANFDCARYEVNTFSTQTEGLMARQEMWFSKAPQSKGLLMKRQDFDAMLDISDAPVTERSSSPDLGGLRQLVVRPPEVPEKNIPYALEKELIYTVHVKEKEMGKCRVTFSANPKDQLALLGAKYCASARVDFNGRDAERHENAITFFDSNWRPIRYEAKGEESADVKAQYTILTKAFGGRIDIQLRREVAPPVVVAPVILKGKPDVPVPLAPVTDAWKDPLKRVPISDEEAASQEVVQTAPRLSQSDLSRRLSTGTFLFDFNRVEQLAVLAHRMPIPPAVKETPTEPGAAAPPVPSAFQKVAMYFVRQNRSGVLLFEVRPEAKPKMTPRQKLRMTQTEKDEPQLYIARTESALLPCSMLLTPDGRMLELTLRMGSSEIIYTMDDPIMRARAERAKKKKQQEGPQIIRPPWW